MPTYCTDADVLAYLPTADGTDLGSSLDTAEERAPYITRGSRATDESAGGRFALGTHDSATQKFPNVASDPSTPECIRELASLWTAALILDAIHSANRRVTTGGERRADAEALAAVIKAGERDVIDSDGTRYGDSSSLISHTGAGSEPVFTIGRYDADGNQVSDEAGTTDDFVS